MRTAPAPAPGASAPHLVRLLRHGPRALADWELLAVLLGGGGPVPAPVLAARLLCGHGPVARLVGSRPQVLCREPGLGLARAARLVAAGELGARGAAARRAAGPAVRRPADLEPLLREEFRGCEREHFLALYLDARHRVTAVETVSIGSLDASLVHPREVFRPALALGAAALIVAHNHPSGCPSPSADDLELTRRLLHCGRLLGIELLDHVIVAGDRQASLREEGWPEP